MEKDHFQQRRETYSRLSSQIALIDDERLCALLDNSEISRGWGRTQCLDIDGSNVFIKRVPITDLEYANPFSTNNRYDLPMYYNYGVGSAGFGIFRELITHIKTTNWVLEGAISSFPLMYHYRFLPFRGERAETDQERHTRYVDYWGSSASVGQLMLDKASANHEAIIFLEHIPHTVGTWLADHPHRVNDLVAEMRDTITFLRKNGVIHLDAHFHNMLTDGERFYLTDYGLALDRSFDLTEAELTFFRDNNYYDYGELLACVGSVLLRIWQHGLSDADKEHIAEKFGIRDGISLDELLSLLRNHSDAIAKDGVLTIDPAIVTCVEKYQGIVAMMHRFYDGMRSNPAKDTPLDHVTLRQLLEDTGFIDQE